MTTQAQSGSIGCPRLPESFPPMPPGACLLAAARTAVTNAEADPDNSDLAVKAAQLTRVADQVAGAVGLAPEYGSETCSRLGVCAVVRAYALANQVATEQASGAARRQIW